MSAGGREPRRLVVLGGSRHHRGGLEAYCERAVAATGRHAPGWRAEWWPSETAYFTPGRAAAVHGVWRRLGDLGGVNLVWLQWSTLLDLLFLRRIAARGVPVLVTPHLGAAARLQRSPALRRLCVRLLGGAHRLGLLFDGQEVEIALPPGLARATIGTFLPEEALASPPPPREGPLRLIHAGRLSAAKGTFRMIELCATLRARGVPFTAAIVGRAEPPVTAALAAAIDAAALGGSVTLSGWMDGPALRAALADADVLVHLSKLDSFPLIVLEALAAGALPIVADMAGAAAMVRRYDGLIAQDGGIEAAAGWLAGQDLAALRRRAADAGVLVRRDQAWERVVARLIDAMEATVSGTG